MPTRGTGGAAPLAVDRDRLFHDAVGAAIAAEPLIRIERGEIAGLPPEDWTNAIVATGPLTSPPLAEAIRALTGEDSLAFFDAIAPIVYRESIDFGVAWFQSRYDKAGPAGTGSDYINCPMNEAQYESFIDALLTAEKTEFKDWERDTPYFEGCLPIEVMAERGRDTLRFGPMKPVGLTDPEYRPARACRRPAAARTTRSARFYNLVGFQTKLRHGEQRRVFRRDSGDWENAEFARLGGLHRNTFINSPRLLDPTLRLRAAPRLRFAGPDHRGWRGYVESAAIGLLAGRFRGGRQPRPVFRSPSPRPPRSAPCWAISRAARTPEVFQPMNVNFGLLPPLAERKRGTRPQAGLLRAGADRSGTLVRSGIRRGPNSAWSSRPGRCGTEPRAARMQGPDRRRRDLCAEPDAADTLRTWQAEETPPRAPTGMSWRLRRSASMCLRARAAMGLTASAKFPGGARSKSAAGAIPASVIDDRGT